MKRVTTLHVRGRQFQIVRNAEGFFLAIEDKYLDANGCLTETLNGFQMHASKDLATCLETTKDAVEIDYLKSTGLDKDEAFKVWYLNKYGRALQLQA